VELHATTAAAAESCGRNNGAQATGPSYSNLRDKRPDEEKGTTASGGAKLEGAELSGTHAPLHLSKPRLTRRLIFNSCKRSTRMCASYSAYIAAKLLLNAGKKRETKCTRRET